MNSSTLCKRRITRFAIALSLIAFAIYVSWSYRGNAGDDSAELPPTTAKPVLLPAGTAIEAQISNGVASFAIAGDRVTAFVSEPVVSKGRVVVPTGAELGGNLENVSVSPAGRKVRMIFTVLLIRGRCFAIQTRPLVLVTPVQSNIDILATAFRTLFGAAVGGALGASSGDERMINGGVLFGAEASDAATSSVHITVVLACESVLIPRPH